MKKTTRETAERFAGLAALPLAVAVKVGETRCSLGRLAEMKSGEIVSLDRRIGEPFELRSGGVLLARVEPVAQDDGIAVKIVEVPTDDDDAGA